MIKEISSRNQHVITRLIKKINGVEKNYYHTQRNNKINPYGACNITSLNTVFDFLQIDYTDDEVMEMTRTPEIIKYYKVSGLLKIFGNWFLKKKKLNLIWKVLEKVANDVFQKHNAGIRAGFTSFKNLYQISELIHEIQIPVILGTSFTRSGHVVVCSGYIKNKDGDLTHLIIHDPYGNPLLKYKGVKGTKGAFVEVPVKIMQEKIKLDRGIIFT